ncbi:MAG: DUF58 domain-containing protein [Oscillospiraceae bacterium]|jgi:uncharacterized protein (DUF58 family)
MIPSRLLYAFSLILSLLLALGYGDGSLGFTLLYSLLLLFLLALLTILLVPASLAVEEALEQDIIFKGEAVTYTLRIQNRGWFFYPRVACHLKNRELVAYGESLLFFPLLPRGKLAREYTLTFAYRGVYDLGVEKLVVVDFLGLFRKTIRPKTALSVTVYPKSDENYLLMLQGGPQKTALFTDPFQEDYSSVADVRKYATSDSLRKVHWKLSAKRGELMVKNFNAYQPDRLILLLDTRTLPLSPMDAAALEDAMVGYLATAADYCMRGSLSANLMFGRKESDQTTLGPGDDVAQLFGLLASIPFIERESVVSVASQIEGPYHLIVFLALLDEEVHNTLKELISFDHDLTLFVFSSPALPVTEEKTYLLESLKAYGAKVHPVALEPEEKEDFPPAS